MSYRTIDFGVLADDTRPLLPGEKRAYSLHATVATRVSAIWFPDLPDLFLTSIHVGKRSQLAVEGPIPTAAFSQLLGGLDFDTVSPGEKFYFAIENCGDKAQLPAARVTIYENGPS